MESSRTPSTANDSSTPVENRAAGSAPAPKKPEYSREQQLALMLDLFSAQMDAALQEAEESVEKLTRAFSGLMGEGSAEDATAATTAQHARDAIVAIQFYDRLAQRLGHVRYSLSTMAMFVCTPANGNAQSDPWNRLHNSLRKLYSSEEERALFELILSGASAEEARVRAADRNRAAMANNIELF
jgi:hypothetical protein